MSKIPEEVADQMALAVADYVRRAVAPLLETQRALLGRLDRLTQQQSAFEKRVAALERKKQ